MELYTLNDIELVKKDIGDIIDTIEEKKLDILEPTRKELLGADKIILDYIKEKKRKVYGGYAQNKMIVIKNPDDAFYPENQIPDIDYYSPEPLLDIKTICDLLHKNGHKHIEGKEALHKETYSIFVNFQNVCDISYVPKNIYHKIPFIELEGINYTHPSFTYIDFYRMITEPYFSSFRWEKIFPRLYKLQKHYPFNKATKGLNNAYDVPNKSIETIDKINRHLYNEIKNKDNFLIIGQHAYNHLLEDSSIMKDKVFGKKYKIIEHPFWQVISTNYIPDTANLIINLQKEYKDKIKYTEFYPLWMFTGYGTVVYYVDGNAEIPILHVISHNNRCMPGVKIEKGKDYLQYGSFDVVLLMNLIASFRSKVAGVEEKQHYHNIMTSHLVEMRNYYLKKNKLTLLDESPFKTFIPECVGSTMEPGRETRLLRDKKYKEGKLVVFKYDPLNPKNPPDYKFANTSGNSIRKPINLKITKYVQNPELLKSFNKPELEDEDEDTGEE